MVGLVVQIVLLVFTVIDSGCPLKCYSDQEGLQWTRCDDRKGFRTCFTKYDQRGVVTARGCSTKDKIFHVECENHVMGRSSEKFCYCSYFLCNGGDSTTQIGWLYCLV